MRADKSILRSRDFIYGSFLANYSGDDLDKKLKHIIRNIVVIITDSYRAAYDNSLTTSVNYYFKSDASYMGHILDTFINILPSDTFGAELKSMMDIFRR